MADHSALEKGYAYSPNTHGHDPLTKEVYGVASSLTPSGEIIHTDPATGEVIQPSRPTTWGLQLRRWINAVGAEENGIERIPESLRTDQNPRDLFTLWTSANVGTATLAFGTLGPALFYLGWWDSFCALLFFNLIGALPPALMATLGPKLGLRTMTIPRYSFGWWPAKLIAFINLLNQIGWAMVNTIAGADILYDVGGGVLPSSVAILIIGLVALIIGLFGYKFVHRWERVSWIVMLVCFCIVAGFGAKHFVNVPMGSGPSETSGILSFGTAIIGFQISWAPIASDYAVYLRSAIKPWKIFLYTFMGLFWSQFLIELLGVALMTTINSSDPAFLAAYNARGVGGLTGQIFEGYGIGVRNFGKFIQAILSFSVVAVVITNVYSLGLNVQIISDYLMKVPRLIWSLIGGAGFLVSLPTSSSGGLHADLYSLRSQPSQAATTCNK